MASLYLILDVKDASRVLKGVAGVAAQQQQQQQADTLDKLYRSAMLAVDQGAVNAVVATMKAFPASEMLQEGCCYALAGLALAEKKVASSAARKGQRAVVPTTSQPQVAQAVLVARTRHANDMGVANAVMCARDALIALGNSSEPSN